MELTLNLGYTQVMELVRQLPANQIAKMKKELPENYIQTKAKSEISDFQEFILKGPVMSDEQYDNFRSLIEGFTQSQQAEFDKGITIENYAKNRNVVL